VDEVVMKDESSKTGSILHCDSQLVKLKRMDESIDLIPWQQIDTIQGKKLKTFWVGMDFGHYTVPYFSVFRNEAMTGRSLGAQFKFGTTRKGRRMWYGHFTTIPANPYEITKFGAGTVRYAKKYSYQSPIAFYWGSEFNFMNAKNNKGAQQTLEPFIGLEKKLFEQVRVHLQFALQINFANKNNSTGFHLTMGIHLLKKNFKEYYDVLNSQRHIPKRKQGTYHYY
jgi:hypothetical protein